MPPRAKRPCRHRGCATVHLSVSRHETHHGDCELQRVFRRVFHRIGLQQNHRQPDQWRGVDWCDHGAPRYVEDGRKNGADVHHHLPGR